MLLFNTFVAVSIAILIMSVWDYIKPLDYLQLHHCQCSSQSFGFGGLQWHNNLGELGTDCNLDMQFSWLQQESFIQEITPPPESNKSCGKIDAAHYCLLQSPCPLLADHQTQDQKKNPANRF